MLLALCYTRAGGTDPDVDQVPDLSLDHVLDITMDLAAEREDVRALKALLDCKD